MTLQISGKPICWYLLHPSLLLTLSLLISHATQKEMKAEENLMLHKLVLGLGFLPAKAKKPYYLPLTYQEIHTYVEQGEKAKKEKVH